MTLTELKYIVALARERHFGRAAQACFVSQPTLSVAIRKLEDELGVALFERGGTEVGITPTGTSVVAQAQRVLEEATRLKEIARQGQNPLQGSLRVGIIYTIAPYLLPHLVPVQIDLAPQMPLVLQENFTVRLLELLRQGEIDCAIVALPISDAGLTVLPLYDEPFFVALPKPHPWAQRVHIGADELKEQTMLLLGAGHCFRDQVLEVCPELLRASTPASASTASSEGMQRTFEGSSLETIRHMVAAGVGITVLPASALATDGGADGQAGQSGRLAYIPFTDPVPQRRVVLAWRKSFPRVPAMQVLAQAVRAARLQGVTYVK